MKPDTEVSLVVVGGEKGWGRTIVCRSGDKKKF